MREVEPAAHPTLADVGTSSFVSPRQVLVGDGASANVGGALSEWGVGPGRVLLVADRAVSMLRLLEPIAAALRFAGYELDGFADVAGEPDLRIASAVVEAVRRAPVTAVVGLGGGSAMDLAKIAALLATNDTTIEDCLGVVADAEPPAPLVLVPTTAGTGAEATRVAIVTVDGRKRIVSHPYLVPLIAVLDPRLTASLPPPITAATGLDAISHAVESFLSTNRSGVTASMGLHALELLAVWLPRAFADGADMRARRAMQYAAYLSGLSLNAGVVLGHSMAYTIATRTGLPHGITCAMALPFCVLYNAAAAGQQIRVLAERVTATDGAGEDDLVAWLVSRNHDLGVPPSLGSAAIQRSEIDRMVTECMEHYPRPNNPAPFERERLGRLYAGALDGDIDGCRAALTSSRR